MPVFEYNCQDCNTRFEVFHKSASKLDEIKCPKCKSANSKKLLSTFSASVPGSPSKSFDDACISGNCPASLPGGGCASGMCGLN